MTARTHDQREHNSDSHGVRSRIYQPGAGASTTETSSENNPMGELMNSNANDREAINNSTNPNHNEDHIEVDVDPLAILNFKDDNDLTDDTDSHDDDEYYVPAENEKEYLNEDRNNGPGTSLNLIK